MARKNSEQACLWTVISVLDVEGALTGKTVAISGHLGLPRAKIIEIIQRTGAIFQSSLRFDTDYLVCNNDWNKGTTIQTDASSKLLAAKRNPRTKILSEQEFIDLIAQNGKSMADDVSIPFI